MIYKYLDASRYQGKIDWDAVKRSGKIDGAILKTVSTNKSFGGVYIDPQFERNYSECTRLGIPVGAYYYPYAQNEAARAVELVKVRQALTGKTFQLPVAVDVEDNKLKPIPAKELSALVAGAAKQIEDWGLYAMVYTYTSYANTELDMDALKAYLDELDTDLNTVDTVVKTGNPMADAILNSKISLARSRNIPTQVDAHIPVKLKMSELDLCCIIGNLFDNAMEASMALPEEKRMIRVYMDMKGTQLYISFTNFTAAKKLDKVGKGFKTSKGEGHGFGLVRIDDIVSRYDGYLSRNSEDGAFTTEILIPQV